MESHEKKSDQTFSVWTADGKSVTQVPFPVNRKTIRDEPTYEELRERVEAARRIT